MDNSAYPAIKVKISHDAGDAGGCEGAGSGADDVWAERVSEPDEPSPAELDRMNTAMKALLVQQDPSLKEVFAKHPAWEPMKASAVSRFRR